MKAFRRRHEEGITSTVTSATTALSLISIVAIAALLIATTALIATRETA